MNTKTRPPCPECPFRRTSEKLYEEESIDLLQEGWEPACYMIVGPIILQEPVPEPGTECTGYAAFEAGEPGFCHPVMVPRLK